jgi:predicted XRE-type DNA-binding protein
MTPITEGKYHRWEDVRATRADEISDERRAEIRAELEAEITAYRLAEIRKDQRLTQTDVAHEMGVSQKRISEIESAELARTEVSTIRRYVEALGGHLRLVADFPRHTITIR